MSIRIGVVGMGFMGQTHARAVGTVPGARLAATCDHQGERRRGSGSVAGNLNTGGAFDAGEAVAFERPDDLFASGLVDAAVIATPTDTHVDLATRALRAGLDVLVEKPVALHAEQIAALIEERDRARRLAIPAMCMRFWPGWPLLREVVRDGRFGALRALRLARLGSRPEWSDFYRDESRCGGAIFDLHVHDADFVLHLLGRPREVVCVGTHDHVAAMYRYDDTAMVVLAEGGWMPSSGRGFRMRYGAEFERATIEFDLSRTPTVAVTSDGQTTSPDLPAGSGYELQMAHFVACVQARREGRPVPEHPTLEDSVAVTTMIHAKRESLRRGAGFAL
ncbi:MAG: Gfo/Idh/MocA family oxidoreductase [Planctomycetota bacterium]|nr:Gfo/Idh/MocA family oxidoreductase [Planctomycetota bacterium]